MKFLLCTWGSSGDLHPFLSLGNELRRRGHEVTLVGLGTWADKARQAGLQLVAAEPGRSPEGMDIHPDLFSHRNFGLDSFRILMRDFVLPTFGPWTDCLLRLAPDFDCLVAHSFVLVAPVVAEKTGIRFVSASLAPGVIPSDYSMPAGSDLNPFRGWLGRKINRAIWKTGMRLIRPHVDPEVNRLRSKYGLSPVENTAFQSVSPDLHLQLYSRHFASREPDWPPFLQHAGFCFWDEDGAWSPPKELTHFLEAGAKPVLFTLGTSAIMSPRRFYEDAVEAVQNSRHRAILLTGLKKNQPVNLPQNVLALNYAPHGWIMPRCSTIVHQCGIGTTSQALRAGLPSILCPFAFDQPNNAMRVRALGAGIVLSPKKRNAWKMREAVERVTGDPSFQESARAIAQRIAGENGPSLAAKSLEQFVGQKRSSERF